eukprot:CAMPEP_0172444118 /NCGR_PEP_ID=MMETSP1065-20121228/4220_1 /TAXON_ID=265537 /ORGANISM="Amphiprora paludosa, Strain CCMP125" /LENGTH=174 /DNA_ID=CAMNT_0013194537 /DNA_START=102 /DNA_END=626 /DNA_ORIENTATION=+
MRSVAILLSAFSAPILMADAFVSVRTSAPIANGRDSRLFSTEEKAAPIVSGEELEKFLTEWDQPLVVDAYATWCGPCLLMAPEFEAAAQELKGKVRFVKLDTDKEEAMAARLNIMGLPTLLFLDQYTPKEDEEEDKNSGAKAVLKGRIEGALRKENIVDLCEHYFFDGPAPQLF